MAVSWAYRPIILRRCHRCSRRQATTPHSSASGIWASPGLWPQRSGYDYFFGNHHGAIDYFTHKPGVGEQFDRDLWQGSEPVERSGYYTYILGDEATRYVQERKNIAKPFFLSLHFTAPHWPWEGRMTSMSLTASRTCFTTTAAA